MASLDFEVPIHERFSTLYELADFRLENEPTSSFYFFAADDETSEPACITQLEFTRATHRAAGVLQPALSAGNSSTVVAIIANIDALLYQTCLVGLMRAGYAPFPISPRTSLPAVLNLLHKTACTSILAGGAMVQTLLESLKAQMKTEGTELTIVDTPSTLTLYPLLAHETEQDPFTPYTPTHTRNHPGDMCLVVHSSGSTGFPKPIPCTNSIVMKWGDLPMNSDKGTDYTNVRLATMPIPPSHGSALAFQIFRPLFHLKAVCIYPPSDIHDPNGAPVVSTAENILEHSRRTRANAIFTIPFFAEQWAASTDAIDYLKTLDFIVVSGGPLVPDKGRHLASQGVKLQTAYGGSEIGCIGILPPHNAPDVEDGWSWMRIAPQTNPRWVPQGDGSFELQFLTCEAHEVAVENLLDARGFTTSDLCRRHPTRTELFKIVGRKDDVIVLASGENVVPAPIEATIGSHPKVASAMIFGRDRNQPGVLIEPNVELDRSNPDWLSKFRRELWPVVERANEEAPVFSHISEDMILVTSPGKPMPRAAKATILRRATLMEYETEIGLLYDAVEPSEDTLHFGKEVMGDLSQTDLDSANTLLLRNSILSVIRQPVLGTDVSGAPKFESDKPANEFDLPKAIDLEKGENTPKEARKANEVQVLPPNNLLIVFPGFMLALFLAALDQTIIGIALPRIAQDLGIGSGYSWVGSAYILPSAALAPLTGKLSDIFGRKPLLLTSILLFLFGSAMCGAARNFLWLAVSRGIQGVGAAGINALVQVTISDIIPLEVRGAYIGALGAVYAIASVLGPLMGGLLTDHVSWRWCFWINLPTGGLSAAIVLFSLKLNPKEKLSLLEVVKDFDFLGLFLVIAGIILVLLGFTNGQDSWSSAASIAPLALAVVLLIAGGVNEVYTSRSPIIPPRLFRTRTTAGLLISVFLHGIAFLAATYYIPLYFQILGSTATLAGVKMLAFSLGTALAATVSGLVIKKTTAYRPTLWFGWAVICLGFGLMIMLNNHTNLAATEIYLFIAAVGNGCLFSTPIIALQASMPVKEMATSTVALILVRSLGGALGVALGGTIYATELRRKLSNIPGYTPVANSDIANNVSGLVNISPPELRDAVLRAYTASISSIWIACTPILFVGFLFVLLVRAYSLRRPTAPSPAKVVVEEGAAEGTSASKSQ